MSAGRGDDYLWDRGGRDAEIERLERLLAPLRAQASVLPRSAAPRRRLARPRWRARLALAAAASLAVLLLGWGALAWRLAWPDGQAWRVQASRGEVLLDGRPVRPGDALAAGGELRTGAGATVRLEVARIGQARLDPGSRLRLERTRTGEHRVVLAEGGLWARVWAPPRQFGVRLAQAEVVDLGCEFEVQAAPDGSGWLRVRSGWVAVEAGTREVLVPAGARVALAAGGVPATPHDEGADAAFVDALREVDARGAALDPAGPEVRRLLATARRADALSLLSLLAQRPALAHGPLFDHLQAQWPALRVDRDGVARGAAAALEPWWRALPYPRVKRWWLHWADALPVAAEDDAAPARG